MKTASLLPRATEWTRAALLSGAALPVPSQTGLPPHLTPPHLTSPHLTSPHLTSPQLTMLSLS